MDRKNHYDAIIIGFGKGGKTLVGVLGNAGKRTALIEKSPMMYGGTCINVGCIPTKFLVHRAKAAKFAEDKSAYYAQAINAELALTEKLREKNLAKADSSPNVNVIVGTARLLSSTEVEVSTEQTAEVLTAEQIFLNTGSVPFVPPIEGIQDNPYVVNSEGLLKQTRLPKELVIIGGGYIGVEFASVYADFGSKVTVIQNGSRFLPREDEDIADAVRAELSRRGVELLTDTAVVSASAIPKALVTEQPAGILKAIIDEKTGLILGAHLFCEEAHEMINTVKLAMDAKLPYTALRDMIFTHPTMSEALNDLFNIAIR